MKQQKKIEAILAAQGFSDYVWIDPEDIVVAQWVRVKCTFGCADYGLGTCPPNTPSVSECERFFGEYEHAVIVRLSVEADKQAYPSKWSRDATAKLLEAERQIFLLGYQKAFLLNQTCCTLCSDCSGDRFGCKDKKNSRPSPESFAVDVYSTVRNAGMEINVISKTPSEIHRIAVLLID